MKREGYKYKNLLINMRQYDSAALDEIMNGLGGSGWQLIRTINWPDDHLVLFVFELPLGVK